MKLVLALAATSRRSRIVKGPVVECERKTMSMTAASRTTNQIPMMEKGPIFIAADKATNSVDPVDTVGTLRRFHAKYCKSEAEEQLHASAACGRRRFLNAAVLTILATVT